MKTIKLQYDVATGEITGYYPSDIYYADTIKPAIEITEKEYNAVLHNEDKFRVQNKTLIDISDTAEYQKQENKKLLLSAKEKINKDAAYAYSYGVIFVDEKYYVNVNWQEYYVYMQKFIERDSRDVSLKMYNRMGSIYDIVYKNFSSDEAKILVENVLTSIDNYRNQYVPEKQKELLTELDKLQKSNSTKKIRSFYESINYGLVIQDKI